MCIKQDLIMLELVSENKRLKAEITKLKDLIVAVVTESTQIKAANPFGKIIN